MRLDFVGVTLARRGAVVLDFSPRPDPSTRDPGFYFEQHQDRHYNVMNESVHHAGLGLEDEVSVDTRCCSEYAYDPY